MKRIGIIHANTAAVDPVRHAFREEKPDWTFLNFVDEYLLDRVNEIGYVDDIALRRFTSLIFTAAEAQVDAIIVACSVFAAYVPGLTQFLGIPLFAIDAPMIRRAAKIGGKIGVVATTAAAAPTTRRQLEARKEQGKPLEIVEAVHTEAMDLLKAGKAEEHDRILCAAVKSLADSGCSAVVLCQGSMARALPRMKDVGVPVLASPYEAIRELDAAFAEK